MVAPFKSYTRSVSRHVPKMLPWGTWIQVLDFSISRSGVTQAPPYVDTAYSVLKYLHEGGFNDGMLTDTTIERDLVSASNLARAKFVGALGDASSFGATFTAERKSTWGTVVNAIVGAGRAAKAVSRGQLGKAANILGFRPPIEKTRKSIRRKGRKGKRIISVDRWVMPDGRKVVVGAANKWLWFSYGVKPLMVDIYNGMDILTRESPWKVVKGSGKAGSATTGASPTVSTSSVRVSAHVRVANPNLWLANQLGLINPVQWINEAIPFSFVVDWFSNLSQIIMQMTDFVGLEIAQPLTTSKSRLIQTSTDSFGLANTNTMETFKRSLSIPTAKLRFSYEAFSWQRGANAISLLLVIFTKK